MSIELMRVPCKQFGDVARELMEKKIDMVSHARHHVYTRTKKKEKSDWVRQGKRRGLDEIYFLHLS